MTGVQGSSDDAVGVVDGEPGSPGFFLLGSALDAVIPGWRENGESLPPEVQELLTGGQGFVAEEMGFLSIEDGTADLLSLSSGISNSDNSNVIALLGQIKSTMLSVGIPGNVVAAVVDGLRHPGYLDLLRMLLDISGNTKLGTGVYLLELLWFIQMWLEKHRNCREPTEEEQAQIDEAVKELSGKVGVDLTGKVFFVICDDPDDAYADTSLLPFDIIIIRLRKPALRPGQLIETLIHEWLHVNVERGFRFVDPHRMYSVGTKEFIYHLQMYYTTARILCEFIEQSTDEDREALCKAHIALRDKIAGMLMRSHVSKEQLDQIMDALICPACPEENK